MKYCVEISEEQLRIISVAVDEYMRLRMGQFEPLTEDLVFDGEDKKQLYEKPYDIRVYNERKHCIETMFEAAYKLAYPPFGHRERQHDSWGTCIDLVHAIEHQQWLDAPENKREAPGTTNRSFDPVPLGHEPFPKIERVDELAVCLARTTYPLTRPSSAPMPRARPILCPACAKLVQTT